MSDLDAVRAGVSQEKTGIGWAAEKSGVDIDGDRATSRRRRSRMPFAGNLCRVAGRHNPIRAATSAAERFARDVILLVPMAAPPHS
jgi:hypothetical protein